MSRGTVQSKRSDVSSYAIGVHLAHAADVAAADGCRDAAELLVSAVYAAFSSDPTASDLVLGDGVAA